MPDLRFLRDLLKRILAAGGTVEWEAPGLPALVYPPEFEVEVARHGQALKALILAEGVPTLSRVEREVYKAGVWMPPER